MIFRDVMHELAHRVGQYRGARGELTEAWWLFRVLYRT
jgi:hypothetical protein